MYEYYVDYTLYSYIISSVSAIVCKVKPIYIMGIQSTKSEFPCTHDGNRIYVMGFQYTHDGNRAYAMGNLIYP